MDDLIDRELAVTRKLRALRAAAPGADFLMKRAAEELAERLALVERRFERGAALFSVTDDAAAALRDSGKVGEVVRVEAHSAMLDGAGGLVSAPEMLPFEPERLDLAVSLLALHEVNDLPGLLVQIRRALKPDGLFLACLPGAGTLAELRECLLAAETELAGGAAPRVIPFADVRDAGGLLQRAGLALPVADLESVTVRYGTPFDLMRDVRAMGAASALADRPRKPSSRALFLRAAELYAERFADPDGRVRATFKLIWLSGWAPAPGQQQPLRPGSARASLADALRDAEAKAT